MPPKDLESIVHPGYSLKMFFIDTFFITNIIHSNIIHWKYQTWQYLLKVRTLDIIYWQVCAFILLFLSIYKHLRAWTKFLEIYVNEHVLMNLMSLNKLIYSIKTTSHMLAFHCWFSSFKPKTISSNNVMLQYFPMVIARSSLEPRKLNTWELPFESRFLI